MSGTKNKKIMNQRGRILLCLGIFVGLLSGCGGEYVGLAEGDVVSGSAVSTEAVSGDAVREKPVSSHRFCTDTNLYYVSEDESKLMQARTDGTHRKCIKEWPAKKDEEKYEEVVYADENWLYYNVIFDYEEEITYRAPIEKDAQGYDVVNFQKEEELVKEELIFPFYADSDYYFYKYMQDGKCTGKLVKYDLKKKRKVTEIKEYGDIFRIKDDYIIADHRLYIQDLDSVQWKKLSDYVQDPDDDKEMIVHNAEALFYPTYVTKKADDRRFDIKRHDGKKETDFITWEQLDHAVKEASGEEKPDVCMPDQLFWEKERLYIQMQTGWMKDGTYHMGYMIFSQGENEDGSGCGLRYEKELTECMRSYVKEQTGKWCDSTEVDVEHMVVNDAQCIAMVGGKAYLSLYDYEKDKGRLACYDLDTGDFEWINRQDAAFYKLGYDCAYGPYNFSGVFDEYGDNEFVNVWKWRPLKDEDDDGSFVEDRER